MNKKRCLVVNLIGGPGCGKSTTTAGLFYELKKKGYNCEMSLEFAKEKVYEESFRTMNDQIYIFGKQFHKLWRLKDKVDIIITDSPLVISLYYNKEESKHFDNFVVEQYNKFNNLLYFIDRGDIEFQESGRLHNKKQSIEIDNRLKTILTEKGVEFKTVNTCDALDSILKDIEKTLKEEEENEHSFDYPELKNLTLYELQQRVDQCVEHINKFGRRNLYQSEFEELNTYLMEGYSRSCTCSDEEIEEFKRGISNGTIGNNTLYNPRTDRHLQTIRIQLESR